VSPAGRRRLRKDANHAAIRDGLRQLGKEVLDAASYGLPIDLLARSRWWPNGVWLALEVKTDGGKLTESEAVLAAVDGILVIRSLDDALEGLAWAGDFLAPA